MKNSFLYIVNEFPPAGMQSGIRALEFSKRLIDDEIFPVILTKRIDRSKILNLSLISEIPASLKILRTPFLKLRNYLFFIERLFKFDVYLEWIPYGYAKGKKILQENKDIKFIYASGPLFNTHIIGYLLSKKFQIPLVIEYRDPWSFNLYTKKNYHILNKKIDLALEKRILQSADIIITISPALKSFLLRTFPFIKNKPIFSIANGLKFQNINQSQQKDIREIILTFTGTLYGKRNIIPLLKIVSQLKKENFFKNTKISIRIFGNYPKEYLEYAIIKLNIKDMVFLGDIVPRSDALEEINKCTLAIHVGEAINYPTIAFKVWDYLGFRKKILYLGLEESYTAKFIKQNNIGIVIPIDNLSKGKETLENLINNIENNEFHFSIEQKKLEKFSWDYKAKKLINNVINELLNS